MRKSIVYFFYIAICFCGMTILFVGKNGFSSERLAQVHNKNYYVNRHVILFVIKIKYKAKDTDHNLWSISGYPCRLTFETMIFQSKPPSCIWKYVWVYYFSVAEKRKISFSFWSLSHFFLNCRQKSLSLFSFRKVLHVLS